MASYRAAPPPPQPPRPRRLRRLPNSATSEGPDYEFKLAGLLALRARRMGLEFEVFSNVEVARPCDDLVVRVHYPYKATILMQLKHGKGEKGVSLKGFLQTSGDFSLVKYFDFFSNLTRAHAARDALACDDQRLLTDCALEDVRVVLYTTKHAACGREGESAAGDAQGEPYEQLLRTGNGSVRRFGPRDQKVWELLRGSPEEELFQKRFLRQLAVFHGQEHADALDGAIAEELQRLLGGEEARRLSDRLLARYLAFLKAWAQDPARNFCLSHTSRELHDILGSEMQRMALHAAGGGAIAFLPALCGQLRSALARPQHVRVAVPGVPAGLRAAKTLQVLCEDFPGRWVYVNESILEEFPQEALEFVCAARDAFLVVDVEGEMQGRARNLVQSAGQRMKVLVLCSPEDGVCAEKDWVTLHEDWRMLYLTPKSQDEMMNKDILFQGCRLRLRELEGAWPRLREDVDGALLGALLRGDAALGTAPPTTLLAADQHLHVPRSLQHATALDPAVLRVRARNEHLALSGFAREELRELQQHLAEGGDARWTVLSAAGEGSAAQDEAAFRRVCGERSGCNVHWVERVGGAGGGGALVWRDSSGSTAALQPHVLPPSAGCARPHAPTCVHASAHAERDAAAWGARAALLLGEAGVGKTRFLARAAAKARRHAPARWAVWVPLLAHRHLLRRMPDRLEDIGPQHALEVVAAAAGVASNSSGHRFLEAALTGSGAVQLFVDGVDELCPAHKGKALRFLEVLLQTRAESVWVASRPEIEESLRRTLGCIPLTLRPLLAAEQREYLCAHWASVWNLPPHTFAPFASEMAKALEGRSEAGNERRSLLDIPLHLNMAAVAFADDAGKAMREGGQVLGGRALNLLELYRKFVQLKRQRYKDHHGLNLANIENSYMQELEDDLFNRIHQMCAIHLLVSSELLPNSDPSFHECWQEHRTFLQKEKAGIMWLGEDSSLQFSHYTFIEYFAASWLSQNAQKIPDMVRAVFKEQGESQMRTFLDLMLAEGCRLHEAALAGDGAALVAALAEGEAAQARDRGGRLALHLAAAHGRSNVLDALLAAGCDPSRRDAVLQWTPLHYALAARDPAMAERLLRAGAASAAGGGAVAQHQQELLLTAARSGFVEVTRFLLQTTSDIPRQLLISLCHIAAAQGDVVNVDLLLSQGVPPNSEQDGRSLMQEAVLHGHTAIVQRLIKAGAKIKQCDASGNTLLHLAASQNHAAAATLLADGGARLNAVNAIGKTALHIASLQGYVATAEVLLAAGAKVNKPQARPSEPLSPLCLAAVAGDLQMVQLLLARGACARVNSALWIRWAPLVVAAQKGHVAIVQALLAAGADPNETLEDDKSALHLAVIGGHLEVARLLVAAGADVRRPCRQWKTPLHYAVSKADHAMVKFLQVGNTHRIRDIEGISPLDIVVKLKDQDLTASFKEAGIDIKKEVPMECTRSCKIKCHRDCERLWLPAFSAIIIFILVSSVAYSVSSISDQYYTFSLLWGLWPVIHILGQGICQFFTRQWNIFKYYRLPCCVIFYLLYYADTPRNLMATISEVKNFPSIVILVGTILIGTTVLEVLSNIFKNNLKSGNISRTRKSFFYIIFVFIWANIAVSFEMWILTRASMSQNNKKNILCAVFSCITLLILTLELACRSPRNSFQSPKRCEMFVSLRCYYAMLTAGTVRWGSLYYLFSTKDLDMLDERVQSPQLMFLVMGALMPLLHLT